MGIHNLYPMKTPYSKQEQDYLREVGQRIRTARQSLGVSQEIFAKTCKLDRTYISDVERGGRNISLLNLRKIATALGKPPEEII